MADSDIQFLGNWNSHQAPSNVGFVSAIVLTPTTSSPPSLEIAARTYSRTETSVVHIGRVPTIDMATAEDRAGFVNPVMSRSHAKITFADSGSAFIIDTNSHHGTSVARAVGLSSVKLAPESPYQLQDGDMITFGKEVLKNGVCHEPLTVAVKLLRTAATPSPMSISSATHSPRSRNRFGLDPSSDSESSESDLEDKAPCTGPNAIQVDLPLGGFRSRLDSKKSDDRIFVLDSPSSSPSSRQLSPIGTPPAPANRLSSSPGSPDYSPGADAFSPPPGLELSNMSQPLDSQESSSPIPLTTAVAPPWRRANPFDLATFAGSFMPARTHIPLQIPEIPLRPSQPRKIGRLLNPLWMRSLRASGAEGSKTGMLAMDGDRGRLDADWGVYGRDGSEMKSEVRSVKESVDVLRKDVEMVKAQAHKGEGGSGSRKLMFESKIPAALRELDGLKDDVTVLKNDVGAVRFDTGVMKGQVATLRALDADVEGLKDNTGSLTQDVEMLQGDLGALKADIESVRDEVANKEGGSTADIEKVTADVARLQNDARLFRAEAAGSRSTIGTLQAGFGTLRGEFAGLQGEFETLLGNFGRVDATAQRVVGQVQEIQSSSRTSEQELRAQLREELRAEMRLALAQNSESSSVGTKRKRGDDEALISGNDAAPSAAAAPAPRPYKRLRTVTDFAAAGAVGALGAWLGLAYL